MLARVITARPAAFRRLDALAVDDGEARRGVSFGTLARLDVERVMDAGERAVAMPIDEIVVHGALGRKVLR